VIPLIEAANFTLTQAATADEAIARYRLAELINTLTTPHGFTVTAVVNVLLEFQDSENRE
jgi:hypothetical protein